MAQDQTRQGQETQRPQPTFGNWHAFVASASERQETIERIDRSPSDHPGADAACVGYN